MAILGISASGRTSGITTEIVTAVLEATGEPYEFVSLAGMQIGGCRGCTRCGADNRCKVDDDWPPIGEKMLAADAVVFGAPNYYGMINALGHACLERTFCFRHREVFSLAGKLGVAVGVDGGSQDSAVITYIERMMASNQMAVIGSAYADGYSQCYTCGFGGAVRSVVWWDATASSMPSRSGTCLPGWCSRSVHRCAPTKWGRRWDRSCVRGHARDVYRWLC